jgi:hypothetical protein
MTTPKTKARVRAGTHDGVRLLQIRVDLELWARLEALRHETAMREQQRVTVQRTITELLERGLAA